MNLRRLASGAAGRGPLALALLHGTGAAIAFVWHHYEIKLSPLSAPAQLGSVLWALGAMAALVWTAGALMNLALSLVDVPRRVRPPVRTAERWAIDQLLRHAVVSLGMVLVLVAVAQLPGVLALELLFTALWIAAGLTCGSVRLLVAARVRMAGRRTAVSDALLDESLLLPTADALVDVAAPTWTFLALLELLFHIQAGWFAPFAELSALLGAMREEAIAMLLGPGAPLLAGLVAAFVGAATAWALAWRWLLSTKRPVRPQATGWGRMLPWVGLWLAAGLALGLAGPRERRLWLHHVHPSVDDVARLLRPSVADRLTRGDVGGRAAADALYPNLLDGRGQPRADSVGLPAPASPTAAVARHVLVVYIDSLTRRHLETWGYDRPVAPNIARLARRSVRFDRAQANAPQTDLSTIALFYSRLPLPHLDKAVIYREGHGGVPVHLRARQGGVKVGLFSADWEVHTRGHAPLLPEQCDAFYDARTAQDDDDKAKVMAWAGRDEQDVVDRFLAWYPGVRAQGGRFFAYVKLLRPHAPYYTPPASDRWQPPWQPAAESYTLFDFRPTPERAALLRNRYDNAIHYADAALGRLLDDLERSGALEETLVLLTADHGEAWGEHVLFGHSTQHFAEVLEVPLLMRLPGGAAAGDDRLVGTADIAPTVLEGLGLPPDPDHRGHSLLNARWRPRVHYAGSNVMGPLFSLQVDHWKLIWAPGSDERWLFDLQADPGERHNLAWQDATRRRCEALLSLLRQMAREQLE